MTRRHRMQLNVLYIRNMTISNWKITENYENIINQYKTIREFETLPTNS